MKTFQQFNEDLRQLQRDLNALDYKAAPGQRLAARRQAAKQQSQSAGSEFNSRSADEVAAKKERMS